MTLKGTDKVLLAIVAVVVLLVAFAFALALLRPRATYLPDDKPEGAAYNYLLALQNKDYARAHSYLSPNLKGYPASAKAFAADISRYRQLYGMDAATYTWTVDSTETTGDLTIVTVRETHYYNGGIFGVSQYTSAVDVRLQREDAAYKIIGADSFWVSCWDSTGGCD